MKHTLHIIPLFLLALLSATENLNAGKRTPLKGNGNIITHEINLTEFTQITLTGNIETDASFEYSQVPQNTASLTIEVDENLLSHLNIQVSDGHLTVSTKKNIRLEPTKLIIHGQSATLEEVQISGRFLFSLQTKLKTPKLNIETYGAADARWNPHIETQCCKINVNGAGDLAIEDLQCADLQVEISGAGDVKLKGKVQNGKYEVSGAGDLSAYGCVVENLECEVHGSGDILAHATQTLKAEASGAGDILYKGNPKANVETSFAGTIKKVK